MNSSCWKILRRWNVYIIKKMVVRLRMLYVKMKVFILESFVEKVFGDWVVDWIFI